MSNTRVIWRLLSLTKPFAGWMALAALLGFATIGSSVGLMACAAYIISKAALHPPLAYLQVAIVGVRFFGITRGLFRYAERYVSHDVTFRLLARLRVWFYRGLEPLAPARLMQYRSGDLLSRIVADIETLEHFYLRVVAPPIVAGLVALLMWFFMGSFDIRLAICLMIFFALIGIALPLLTRRQLRGPGRQLVEVRSELNCALVDNIQGMPDLLAFSRETTQLQDTVALDQELAHLQSRVAHISGRNNALSGFLINLATICILLIAIPLVTQGQLDGLYLALLVLAAIASFEAVLPLPLAFEQLESSVAAARRLFEVIDTPPQVVDTAAIFPQPDSYDLAMEHLRFSYDPQGPPVLDNISLSLLEGQHLAVVGPSGSGKTTLVNLLLRFWDYREGHIWLGGHELREYRAEDIRNMMSVVSQNTHLFNSTVRQNLLMARPDAGESDLVRAARQAQIYDFIQSLPKQMDTWIGEQGVQLSAGQRQRLAIARALLQDNPILILDEATANLDALTERELIHTLHNLMEGRSSLTITHRLVGLDNMDSILVLREGCIVEKGRHSDLLQADTLYRRMWELQRTNIRDGEHIYDA